jgi:hypothetical protein
MRASEKPTRNVAIEAKGCTNARGSLPSLQRHESATEVRQLSKEHSRKYFWMPRMQNWQRGPIGRNIGQPHPARQDQNCRIDEFSFATRARRWLRPHAALRRETGGYASWLPGLPLIPEYSCSGARAAGGHVRGPRNNTCTSGGLSTQAGLSPGAAPWDRPLATFL